MATATKYVLRIRTGQKTGPETVAYEYATLQEARAAIKLVEITETPVSLGVEELLATVEPGRCTA